MKTIIMEANLLYNFNRKKSDYIFTKKDAPLFYTSVPAVGMRIKASSAQAQSLLLTAGPPYPALQPQGLLSTVNRA